LPKLLFFFGTEVNGNLDRNVTTVVRVHKGLETLPSGKQSARDPRKLGSVCSTA
jgi:hypothetical protein